MQKERTTPATREATRARAEMPYWLAQTIAILITTGVVFVIAFIFKELAAFAGS